MLNGSKRELGADYQSRIYPTSVLARRASSSTPSPYCLFTWAIFLLNQHTRRCTNKAARPECRHWRRRCILEFCSASKTECRWSGSREITEKNEKASGNGESDKREEKTRYCRMEGRVGEGKTSPQKREHEDEGSKKE